MFMMRITLGAFAHLVMKRLRRKEYSEEAVREVYELEKHMVERLENGGTRRGPWYNLLHEKKFDELMAVFHQIMENYDRQRHKYQRPSGKFHKTYHLAVIKPKKSQQGA